MFGFGRKNRWADPGTPKQFGDGEKVWAEGPAKGNFIDPEETGPTAYDELVERAADAVSHDQLIYKTHKGEDEVYMLQDQLIDEGKKEWASAVKSRDQRKTRQERERHNDAKGGEKISDHLADNDNTERGEDEILRTIDRVG